MGHLHIARGTLEVRRGLHRGDDAARRLGVATRREDSKRDGLAAAKCLFLTPDQGWSRRMSGADQRHVSVLGPEAVAMLAPSDGGLYIDATFGAGGYSRLILSTPGTRVIGIDRDRAAV